MEPIGNIISRVRNQIKAVKQDAFVTDRFLFSMIMKHAKMLVRRQDNLNRIMKFNSVFQTLNYVELITVDAAESSCHDIRSGCMYKRTKDKLPEMLEGGFGPLIRSVTSLDLSEEVTPIFPSIYQRMLTQTTMKYNNRKYYWYSNGYLYFPNLTWDAVRVDGMFLGDTSKYNCENEDDCMFIQDKVFMIPEYLYSEIEQFVMRDLGLMIQIPSDTQHDNKNITR